MVRLSNAAITVKPEKVIDSPTFVIAETTADQQAVQSLDLSFRSVPTVLVSKVLSVSKDDETDELLVDCWSTVVASCPARCTCSPAGSVAAEIRALISLTKLVTLVWSNWDVDEKVTPLQRVLDEMGPEKTKGLTELLTDLNRRLSSQPEFYTQD